ncbi:ABC transporter substrate-binding protein [Streptomyces alkaliphilus]|uniref:ABC transporter substrate-binding protein n=1 Tax=Streptomyces alkaliphilus TaxID=1472722 RepID=UPI0034D21270
MTRTRRTTRTLTTGAALLTGALLLTACGSDDPDGTGGDAATPEGEVGEVGETRTIDTAMGPVEVPVDPRRVVVLDTAELDSALTLGVTPVGSVRADVATGFPFYLPEERLTDVENVGNIAAPNLEAIIELEPDLIIGNMARDADRYDELSAIAPTVFGENPGGPWKENFLLHAEALNRQEEAAAIVEDYEERVAEVVEALGGAEEAADTEVSVIRFIEGGDTRLYGRENYIGTILEDLGLGRPAIVDEAPDGFAVEISPEQVDLGDGDVIFYTSYGSPENSGESAAVGGALWEGMDAVRENRAFAVEDELWFQGIGYTAAGIILGEIEEALAS